MTTTTLERRRASDLCYYFREVRAIRMEYGAQRAVCGGWEGGWVHAGSAECTQYAQMRLFVPYANGISRGGKNSSSLREESVEGGNG